MIVPMLSNPRPAIYLLAALSYFGIMFGAAYNVVLWVVSWF